LVANGSVTHFVKDFLSRLDHEPVPFGISLVDNSLSLEKKIQHAIIVGKRKCNNEFVHISPFRFGAKLPNQS
jgi:hypothetical protein